MKRRLKLLLLCVTLITLSMGSALAQSENQVEDAPTTAKEDGGSADNIALENSVGDDAEIRIRLRRILSEIDNLERITVQVSNSVVQLHGEVESSEARSEAEKLASALEGVVKVDNQIVISRDVTTRVRSTWDRLIQLATDLKAALPVIALALILTVAFWYFAKFAAQQTALWSRLAPNEFIATIISSVVRLIIILLGLLLALYLLDATSIISTVLGAAGIVGLALGFAVRDTVENFIASILLSLRQPFQMNDFVQIDDHEGSVARLTGRATILISADGNQIRLPNSVVYKSIITNFSRHPQRRFELSVPVDESENLINARNIALSAVESVTGVMQSPSPQVHIQSLGEAIVELTAYGWIDQRTHDMLKVRTACAVAIKSALKQADVVMPESTHTLKLIDARAGQTGRTIETGREFETDDRITSEDSDKSDSISSEAVELDTQIDLDENNAVTAQLQQEQSDTQNLLTEGNSE